MKDAAVLIVDDQQEILNSLKRIFRNTYTIFTSTKPGEALEILKQEEIAVILADQRMPEMDGVAFLSKALDLQPDAIRIMVTGYADIEASINAVNKAQVYQYISKPFEPDELKLIVKRAVERYNLNIENKNLQNKLLEANRMLQDENLELHRQVEKQLDIGNLIGHSPEMLNVFKLIKKVVDTPTTVLILGETGTGKEMLAKMIHFNSLRREKRFVVQNCAAVPDTLLQSELFGHIKGAFTGAVKDKKGLFELADQGTIFLDEIGDTTPALQLGLLRVLQENEIKPVGSSQTLNVDVRVIAATNKDLQEEVRSGRFREDLYYRLNVFPVKLPSLSSRKDDIPDLIYFFVEKYARRIGKVITAVEKDVLDILTQADFPGNVRELENEIERMVTLADDKKSISKELLSTRFLENVDTVSTQMPDHSNLKLAVEDLELRMIKNALQELNGNIQKSALKLGISRVGLHKMLKRYGIEAAAYKNK